MVRHMWAEALASPLAPPQLGRRLSFASATRAEATGLSAKVASPQLR